MVLHQTTATCIKRVEFVCYVMQIVPGDRTVNIYESLRQHGLESAASTLPSQYKYKYTLDAEISHVRITACSRLLHIICARKEKCARRICQCQLHSFLSHICSTFSIPLRFTPSGVVYISVVSVCLSVCLSGDNFRKP